MNDLPQVAWFYSREGEKIGPVSFSELQLKAKEGGLNPRLDLVWTQGMDAWQAAGEIEDLFERRTAPEPQQNLAADPCQPLPANSANPMMGNDASWPGARRRSFLIAILVFPILWGLGYGLAQPLLVSQFGPEITQYALLGANFVPALVGIYFSLKRLVNLGMSRWWFLGNLIPLLNLWVCYRCFACPSGYAYHKKLDGAGIFLAIIYWLSLVLVIVAIGLAVAVLIGVWGSLEIQQQVRDVLRAVTTPVP